jgi:hypothetical protein
MCLHQAQKATRGRVPPFWGRRADSCALHLKAAAASFVGPLDEAENLIILKGARISPKPDTLTGLKKHPRQYDKDIYSNIISHGFKSDAD